jgi:hypothetical protein
MQVHEASRGTRQEQKQNCFAKERGKFSDEVVF